jgi:hypothetical protein
MSRSASSCRMAAIIMTLALLDRDNPFKRVGGME